MASRSPVAPFRAAAVFGAVAIVMTAGWASATRSPVVAALAIVRGLGLGAVTALIVTLAIRPLAGPRQAHWRRAMGLTAFTLTALHATAAASLGFIENVALLLYEPQLRAGFTAAATLAILAATSFPTWWAPRQWRILHRGVYGAAILAALHAYQAPHGHPWATTAVPGVITVLLAIRLVPAIVHRRASKSAVSSRPPSEARAAPGRSALRMRRVVDVEKSPKG